MSCQMIKYVVTLILLTSRWLIARWVLIRQWVFWVRFLTTFIVNLWFGMWIASRSSPLIIVGDHHPTCCRKEQGGPHQRNPYKIYDVIIIKYMQVWHCQILYNRMMLASNATMKEANLYSSRNFIAFNLSFNPLVDNKWPGCMNHRTWEKICEYLDRDIT